MLATTAFGFAAVAMVLGTAVWIEANLQRVAALSSNRFLDGAVADHLTSVAGMLTDSSQMSALEWLAAGATGSYGNTTEPCNYREKFPEIGVVMGRHAGFLTAASALGKKFPDDGPHLIYFADPMCSWCYGFSPVIDEIRRIYGNALPVRVVMGGLRPGNAKPMTPEARRDLALERDLQRQAHLGAVHDGGHEVGDGCR